MIYYRLTHFFITRQPDHFHGFDIGIYDSKEKTQAALEYLRTKPGFCLRPRADCWKWDSEAAAATW